MKTNEIIQGNCLEVLRTLGENSIDCCVTSPPYWGLRDYQIEPSVWGGSEDCKHTWGHFIWERKRGSAFGKNAQAGNTKSGISGVGLLQGAFCKDCGAWLGQLGLEPTPELYVEHLVEIFREVRRVLRPDGTLWLNLGDSYAGSGRGGQSETKRSSNWQSAYALKNNNAGLKPKDLVGIPWRVAFALQADGWWLRQDIIWHKPNPMPESVTDRCTKAHEYLFLLSKSKTYYYDSEAIKEPSKYPNDNRKSRAKTTSKVFCNTIGNRVNPGSQTYAKRNKRSVWTVSTKPFKGAHFAVFPEDLILPCVLAGTSPKNCEHCNAPWERIVQKERVPTRPGNNTKTFGKTNEEIGNRDPKRHISVSISEEWKPTCKCNNNEGTNKAIILDPFFGSGTTGLVAMRTGRRYIGIEINEEYIEIAKKRLKE